MSQAQQYHDTHNYTPEDADEVRRLSLREATGKSDEEHTSLTAAVAALGDDQGARPSDEVIAFLRRERLREDAVAAMLPEMIGGTKLERESAAYRALIRLHQAGLVITRRMPS